MAVPTIASGALKKLVASATELGVGSRRALRRRGSRREHARRRRRACADHDRSTRCGSVARAGAPHDADVEKSAYAPGDYGLVGFVVMNSATLAQALDHLVRYIGLWTDEPGFERDRATLRCLYRHAFADRLAALRDRGRAHRGHPRRAPPRRGRASCPREVRFIARLAEPTRRSSRRSSAAPFASAPRTTRSSFAPSDLVAPVAQADAQLGAFLQQIAEDALTKRGAEDGPLDGVRRILADELATRGAVDRRGRDAPRDERAHAAATTRARRHHVPRAPRRRRAPSSRAPTWATDACRSPRSRSCSGSPSRARSTARSSAGPGRRRPRFAPLRASHRGAQVDTPAPTISSGAVVTFDSVCVIGS